MNLDQLPPRDFYKIQDAAARAAYNAATASTVERRHHEQLWHAIDSFERGHAIIAELASDASSSSAGGDIAYVNGVFTIDGDYGPVPGERYTLVFSETTNRDGTERHPLVHPLGPHRSLCGLVPGLTLDAGESSLIAAKNKAMDFHGGVMRVSQCYHIDVQRLPVRITRPTTHPGFGVKVEKTSDDAPPPPLQPADRKLKTGTTRAIQAAATL